MLPEQVNPGPQSVSARHGAFHCGTHVLAWEHVIPPSGSATHCVPVSVLQRKAGPQSESLWQKSEAQVPDGPPSDGVLVRSQVKPFGQSLAAEHDLARASRGNSMASAATTKTE